MIMLSQLSLRRALLEIFFLGMVTVKWLEKIKLYFKYEVANQQTRHYLHLFIVFLFKLCIEVKGNKLKDIVYCVKL